MSATLNLQSAVVTIARPLVAAVVLLALTATAQAQVTSTWNGTSGDWTNPALWSTNPFYPNNGNPPGTTYAVNMGSGTGTLTMNVPITVQSMQMAFGSTKTVTGTGALTVLGQTLMNSADAVFNVPLTTGSLVLGGFNLRGSGPIAVTGSLTAFDNMLVSGSGPITVAGPFSLSGVGQLTLDGRSLTLNGANNTWTGNSLQAQNGAVFTVGSGATLTSTKTFGMFGAFTVNGTYIVDSSPNSTAPVTGPFTNAGTIDIRRNPQPFMASSGLTNTGRVRVAAGNSWAGPITSSGAAAIVTGSGRYEALQPSGIGGLTFNGGRLAPGDGIGSMTVTVPITMGPGSIFEAELGGPTPTAYDQLNLAFGITKGSIALNGPSLNTLLEYAPSPTDSLTIVSGGAVTGTFNGLPNGSEFYVGRFNNTDFVGTITYTATSVTLGNIHPVPEPAAWLLAGGAAIAWTWRRRLRRRNDD